MDSKTYHHKNLKNELIKTGIQIVNEQGLNSLSLRKVAQACGVSHAAPYSHFKNKDELLIEMQKYVTEQLYECLKNAYENMEHSDSPFIEYPEYYSFLFIQPCLNIDLSASGEETDFEPYRYYKEKAYLVYQNEGMNAERIKYGVIAMWAKVHGIASIASMKGIKKDFEWEDVLDKILIE